MRVGILVEQVFLEVGRKTVGNGEMAPSPLIYHPPSLAVADLGDRFSKHIDRIRPLTMLDTWDSEREFRRVKLSAPSIFCGVRYDFAPSDLEARKRAKLIDVSLSKISGEIVRRCNLSSGGFFRAVHSYNPIISLSPDEDMDEMWGLMADHHLVSGASPRRITMEKLHPYLTMTDLQKGMAAGHDGDERIRDFSRLDWEDCDQIHVGFEPHVVEFFAPLPRHHREIEDLVRRGYRVRSFSPPSERMIGDSVKTIVRPRVLRVRDASLVHLPAVPWDLFLYRDLSDVGDLRGIPLHVQEQVRHAREGV